MLVDNGSDDDVAAKVKNRFGDVDQLKLPSNLGWAGGNNAGIKVAMRDGAHYICLLNNDTVVPPHFFETMVDISEKIGPCLLQPAIDYMYPQDGAQIDPSLWENRTPTLGSKTLYAIDFAYGACLLIPTSVFSQIGLFDERFFLQLEETDYYFRAQRIGVRSFCDVGVRIRHAESKSFGGRDTPDKTYYITRNRLLLAEKSRPRWRAYRAALRLILWRADEQANGSVLRWILSGQPQARAMRQGFRDYCLRRFGRRAGPF